MQCIRSGCVVMRQWWGTFYLIMSISCKKMCLTNVVIAGLPDTIMSQERVHTILKTCITRYHCQTPPSAAPDETVCKWTSWCVTLIFMQIGILYWLFVVATVVMTEGFRLSSDRIIIYDNEWSYDSILKFLWGTPVIQYCTSTKLGDL